MRHVRVRPASFTNPLRLDYAKNAAESLWNWVLGFVEFLQTSMARDRSYSVSGAMSIPPGQTTVPNRTEAMANRGEPFNSTKGFLSI